MDDNNRLGSVQYIRSRIANACDGCKAAKVKCDGRLPCGHCAARQRPHTCQYSAPKKRQRPTRSAGESLNGAAIGGNAIINASEADGNVDRRVRRQQQRQQTTPYSTPNATAAVTPAAAGPEPAAEDDTDVPREARLLCDAQGKLIFIGDCAPLSFFQSVRRLVTSRVGQHAFAPESSRYTALENVPLGLHARERSGSSNSPWTAPDVRDAHVKGILEAYLMATTGLLDLFDNAKLPRHLTTWAGHGYHRSRDDPASVVNYLVLAIGSLASNGQEHLSQDYFEYAQDKALATLGSNLSVETVQAFLLITMYMLCSCQINGAFLFFGIAARAAYSIGIHRTEVNARFGFESHHQRNRLWKSVRTIDLYLSASMGRPPSTSDVDCTVPYRRVDAQSAEHLDFMNASVQILLITERIVVDVFSRRKVSLQLTEGISQQLRDWSSRWLHQLKGVLGRTDNAAAVCGACQALSSYYYAVMLVSRPFFMYELVARLSDGPSAGAAPTMAGATGKSKLADACIDAASLMVNTILDPIDRGVLTGRAPLIVSWSFASSLVLGIAFLGGFGRSLEKDCHTSIAVLDHFAKSDPHARQYSLIAQSLLATAQGYLHLREQQARLRRTESSSQLFGLTADAPQPRLDTPSPDMETFLGLNDSLLQTPETGFWDASFGTDDVGLAMNLFPLLEAGGGIDLAHHF